MNFKNIRISTFNMTGAKNTDPHDLFRVFGCDDIFAFEETWLFDTNTDVLEGAFSNHNMIFKSGFDNSVPLIGRPHGGLALGIKLPHQILDVIPTCSRRILPAIVKIFGKEFLVIAVYLPTDYGNADSAVEFSDCLSQVSEVISRCSGRPVILAGDLNCNPTQNGCRAEQVTSFCMAHKLLINPVSPSSEIKISYSKKMGENMRSSLIDWILHSDGFDLDFSFTSISDSPLLNSDHFPVSCIMWLPAHVENTHSAPIRYGTGAKAPLHIRTHLLSNEEWLRFQCVSRNKLSLLRIPTEAISCSRRERHSCNGCLDSLQNYYEAILCALQDAIAEVKPEALIQGKSQRIHKSRRRIPGWSDHVMPKQRLMFQKYTVWKSSNEGHDSLVYLAYSEARREYHRAVRRVKKNQASLRMKAAARSISQAKSSSDFWRRVNRSFPSNRKQASEIDGLPSEDEEVPEIFSKIFEKDFKHYTPGQEKSRLHTALNTPLASQKSECWTQDRVATAVQKLASGKCTSDGIPPEVFSAADPSLAMHLSLLFRTCEFHGFLPLEIAQGTIHPIHKANKDPSRSSSYRPITIGCVMAKIFEACLLLSFGDLLKSNSNQFGYQANRNTVMCSLTIKSVVKHFIKGNSRVFAVGLDATKAFDRVNFYSILERLVSKGIPISVIRLLLSWYESTNIRVVWKKQLSNHSFGINHSVRQGGLTSPTFFTACVLDDLIERLERSGVGCMIGSKYFGVVAYCDDIVLLAPSVTAMNRMLDICSEWSRETHVDFNPSKSQGICFSNRRNQWPLDSRLPFIMGGQVVPTVHSLVHLGIILTWDLDDSQQINRIAESFNRQFYAFLNRFRDLENQSLRNGLYQTFCTSFYSLDAIFPDNVQARTIKFLRKSVNIAQMRLLQLPRESVSQYLFAEGVLNSDHYWSSRNLSLVKRLAFLDTPLTKFLLAELSESILLRCREFRIFPLALPYLTDREISQTVTDKWARDKGIAHWDL
jgi:exonuclease III